ncbi:hypothetical protein TNCV_178611 [Trichonephila clavipes]|nr:hypothetical protein TNCV_2370691 [Trichonephila clavipes]GFT48091.1 hypothetical protein TNCV_178611 [Trichonephila clavipes]
MADYEQLLTEFIDLPITSPKAGTSEEGTKRHRVSFDQVSEFDREKIIAYSDCGLSFREIGQRVRRN